MLAMTPKNKTIKMMKPINSLTNVSSWSGFDEMSRLLSFAVLFTFSLIGWAQTDSTMVRNDSVTWKKSLEGVTVTAQRQLIRQDIDRIGYDVQADEDSKTENVLDMLRKVPMVTIDGEDNILVKGNSNYKIYKNGHLDPSLSKNAREILKAMPASAVKRIEVITDPGAREDAEGVNAILNIVMMDTKKMAGVTGSLTGSYNSLRYPSLGAYLATQLGKAILSVDYGYNYMSKKATTTNGHVERTFVSTGNTEVVDSRGTNPGYVHYVDVNASYDIDTLNLISASFGGYFYKVDVQGGSDVTMCDRGGNPLYHYADDYWMPDYYHHSWNGRLDYEHKTHRKDEKFTLSYMLALTRQHTEQETNYVDALDIPFNYTGFLLNSREHFTEHTFQADYVRPLWEGHKFEIGTKYIFRQNSSDNAQHFYDAASTTTSDLFDHTTQIAAAYADYIYHKGKWVARAGLRYEYSHMKGHYPDGKTADFGKHLSDWVPQASVKYQVDDRQSLKLAYTTSITRPGITYLNPAVYSYPASVQFGNAHLESAREQSILLTYMYVGQRLTLQLVPQFHFYHNALGSIVYAEGDTRYSTYGNVLKQHRFQMEGYVQWKPFNATTFVANITFTDNHANHNAAQLKQHLTSMYYYAYLSQKLPWKLTATAYTYGEVGHSPMNIYAYGRPWMRYAFTLQRSFLSDDRLTVRLMANAPFHKNLHYKTCTTQGDIIGWGDNINTQNNQFFRLSVSYRFGKLKTSVKKTETTIENSDVVGGISKGK